MNKFIVAAMAAGLALSGCGDGNPFEDNATEEETEETTEEGGIEGDRTLPPGTTSPQPNTSIVRTEPTESGGGEIGDGYVTSVSYDSSNDTFYVDNLAFDGDNVYSRGTAVSSLGPYAVYEADRLYQDDFNGNQINQLTHRAIYGVSQSTNTQFAIVRTGAYIDYGFGGFIYQRNNGVTLPTTGQASYTGDYAGIRDFSAKGGLQYTTATVDMAIDFDDFNDSTGSRGDAVRGFVSNRVIYDINGNDITSTVIDQINAASNSSLTALPAMVFKVGPGVMDDNGEITGEVFSTFGANDGSAVSFESGNYYAIISGDNAEEIVGIIVTETSVGQGDGSVRETGGFIVLR